MAEVGSAFVSILPSAKGFGRKLESGVGGELRSSGRRMGSALGSAIKVGALAAVGGALLAGKFLKGALEEAREAQVVTARTENVIASMGNQAKITAKDVAAMAGRLSAVTGIDDEAIQSGENLLLTFGKIRNYVDGQFVGTFDEATALMVDMSAAMGTDMKGSAIQLGKALNDPIKGVSALTRVGVSFTEGQKETIKSLVESGNVLGAQNIILGELKKQFGGAAAAMATPADKAKVAWANFKEEIGTRLLPVVDRMLTKFTAFLPVLLGWVDGLGGIYSILAKGDFAGASKTFGFAEDSGQVAFLFRLRDALIAVGTQVVARFEMVKSALGFLQPVFDTIGNWIKENPAFVKAFATALGVLSVAIWVVTAATTAFSIALNSTGIPLVIIAIAALVAGLVVAYQKSETFRSIVDQVGASIKSFAAFVRDEVVPVVVDLARKVGGYLQPVWDQLVSTFKTNVLPTVQQVVAKFREWQPAIQEVIAVTVRVIAKLVEFGAKVLSAVLPPLIRFAGFIFSNVVPAILTMIENAARGAAMMIDFGRAVVDRVQDFQRFVAGVKQKMGEAVSFVAGIPGKIKSALGNLGAMLYDAGRQVIQGLINGIRSMAGAAASAAMDAVQGAIDGAKGALGINSPSRVFMELGDFTMQGLIKGFANRSPEAVAAMRFILTKIREDSGKELDKLKATFVEKFEAALDAVREALEAKRDTIKSTLDGLRSDFASLRDGIASTFTGNLFEAEGIGGFLSNLVNTSNNLKALKAAFKKLLGYGLSPQFLSQLFASGNGGLILDLAAGPAGAALQGQQLFNEVNALGNSLGSTVARNEFGPEIDRVVNKLERIEKRLADMPRDFAREINGAVRNGERKAS